MGLLLIGFMIGLIPGLEIARRAHRETGERLAESSRLLAKAIDTFWKDPRP